MLRRLPPAVLATVIGAFASASAAHAATVHHTKAGNREASGALLRRSDLSLRWHVATPAPRSAAQLTCAAFRPPEPGVVQTGSAASAVFSPDTDGPFVSEAAYAYGNAGQASVVWRADARPGLAHCLAAALSRTTGGGVSFTVTGRGGIPAAALGRPRVRVTGYRLTGEAHSSSQSVGVVLDTVLLYRGPVLAAVTVASFDAPVAPALEHRIVAAAARRI